MTTTTKTKNPAALTTAMPVRGVEYDKSRPETREAWVNQRRGGITATEIRDWGNGSRRREIITAKVTGDVEDLSHLLAVDHGNRREPIIARWIEGKFGIEPCDYVYSHADNPRHLASPDGVHKIFQKYEPGTPDAVLTEIKTSKHDLHPGRLDESRHLISIDHESHFARSNYYTQMQWQMYVMNATVTLFVWEQHDSKVDPETGTYTPVGPPKWAWIPRDQPLIDRLVNEVAPAALAEIDAARIAASATGLPPASDLPSEHAALVAELLAARDAEAIAKAKKEQAWKRLNELYVGEDKPDVSIDAGFARLTVSTSTKDVRKVDMDGARKRAPKLVAQYEALIERYTKAIPQTTQRLTVTPAKGESE